MQVSSVQISKFLLTYLTAILLAVLLVITLPLGDSFLLNSSFDLVELNTNAYYRWNTLITNWTSDGEINFKTTYILALTVLAAICWHKLLQSYLSLFLVFTVMFIASGVTITALSFLAGLGILLLVFKSISHVKPVLNSVIVLISVLLISFLCQGLSFWCALIACIFLQSSGVALQSMNRYQISLLALTAVLGFLYPHLPQSLNLPFNAVFVPGYNYPYGIDPLIGFQSERVFINKLWVEQRLVLFSLFTLLCGLIFQLKKKNGFLLTALGTVILLHSSVSPNFFKIITPIAALSRIIPHGTLFPVSLILASCGVILVIYKLRQQNADSLNLPIKICASLMCIFFILFSMPENTFGNLISLKKPDSNLYQLPSLYITKQNLPLPSSKPFKTVPLTDRNSDITASTNQTRVAEIYSNKPGSRWSTKPESQQGTEWIEIKFLEPKKLAGIDISNPNFIGDYPRGIKVYGGNIINDRCEENHLLYNEPWWRGSVEILDSGLTYLTTANFVKLYFAPDEDRRIACLKIYQTGKDSFYEWSIERIRIFVFVGAGEEK